MSFRANFVTQHISCSRCLEAAKAHFTPQYFALVVELSPGTLAGKWKGGYAYGPEFATDLMPLHDSLCHDLAVALVTENGEIESLFFGPSHHPFG